MALLVDVDAISKLAHWGLLPELPLLTGESWNNVSTIGSLRYRAQRAASDPDGKLFRRAEAAHATLSALTYMSGLPDVLPEHLAVFQDIPGIDVGEAVLLAALGDHQQRRLLTGDKRALRSLSQLTPDIRNRFTGRIVVIEQVVLCALNAFGISGLRDRICQVRGLDKAIDIAMGSRCDANEEAVRTGLHSYISELRTLCSPSLIAAECHATTQ